MPRSSSSTSWALRQTTSTAISLVSMVTPRAGGGGRTSRGAGRPVSQPGDLWICGEHRVLCGTPRSSSDVERLMDGELADMAFTDPPYNVDYANTAKDKLRGKNRPILNDALGEDFDALLYDACVNILTVTKGACLHLHVVVGARPAAEGLPRGRRQVVDLRHLGQEHLHARARGLPAPVRADPLRLEGRHRSLTGAARATRATSGSSTSRTERSAPDHEAGGAGRAGDPQFVQEPRHRPRPLRRLWHDADRSGAHGTVGAAHRARPEIRRRHRPALAGPTPAEARCSTARTGPSRI